jgi:hypothetical protein
MYHWPYDHFGRRDLGRYQTGCHPVYHWCYRYNYGNCFWDKLTCCDPKRLPQKLFAVKFADVPPPALKEADGMRTEIGELG